MSVGQDSPEQQTVRATRSTLLWAIAFVAFALDLLTKAWARQALTVGESWPSASAPARLRLVFNTNLDFGLTLPGGGTLLYTILGTSVIIAILWAAHGLSSRAMSYVIALGLVIGGGMGNLFERAWRGSATDFLDLHAGAFNIADVMVTLGALLYLWVRTRDGAREEKWTWHAIWVIPHVFPPSVRATSSPA
jgi:signal peptidase II